MSTQNFFHSLASTLTRRRPIHLRRPASRLRIETLEDRALMSTLVVNSALDVTNAGDGLVTLREAIVAANTDTATDLGQVGGGADTIVFDESIRGQNIQLLNGQLSITSDLVIQGLGSADLTIDAGHLSRIFAIGNPHGTTKVELHGLTLTGGQAPTGGAIAASGNLKVVDTVVTGHTATGSASAGVTWDNSYRMPFCYAYQPGDCTIFIPFPYLSTTDGAGGAVFHAGGTLEVTHSVVSNNTAKGDAGGIYAGGGMNIRESVITGNTAVEGNGGGVIGSGTITNSTISGNSARIGGGVYGSGTVTSSTIAFNQAEQGAGIYAIPQYDSLTSSYTALTLQSTIVGSNGGPAGTVGQDITRLNDATVNADHSLIQNVAPGTVNGVNEGNIFGVDPMLAPLANNGGPTQTHALLSVSPAINKGFNPLNLAYDQRGPGFPRVLKASADIGAYESNFDPSDTEVPALSRGITVTSTFGLVTTETGGTARFSVELRAAPLADVTIPLSSSDITEGSISPTSLTFTPQNWDQPQWVTVTGIDDAIIDGDVPYSIVTGPAASLDPLYNGMDADDVSATNKDNEKPPAITISDVQMKEGNWWTEFTFTVRLSVASAGVVTVNYGTADGTAKAGSDYGAVSGTLIFYPGETVQTITIWVYGDTVKEANETFYLNLWGATNATIADGMSIATIMNDDRK